MFRLSDARRRRPSVARKAKYIANQKAAAYPPVYSQGPMVVVRAPQQR